MSQFELTQDQHHLLEHADRFGRDKLLPLAEKMDNEEWWPDELFAELGSLGFLGITVPEKYGGVGMGWFVGHCFFPSVLRHKLCYSTLFLIPFPYLFLLKIQLSVNEFATKRFNTGGLWAACCGLLCPMKEVC